MSGAPGRFGEFGGMYAPETLVAPLVELEARWLELRGDDGFLAEQLRPERFAEACSAAGQALELRMQPGYDHSFYFIASFIEDHLRFHARHLAD